MEGSSGGARKCRRVVIGAAICFNLLMVLGCATQNQTVAHGPDTEALREANISEALLEGKLDTARQLLSASLAADPKNGYLHLLNGLSYQLADGSQQSLDLAKVGYDAAVKFAPGYFWAHYMNGLVLLGKKEYTDAAEQFSWAILDNPDRPLAFAALAVSAYYAGDLDVARIAAERAFTLAPEDPVMVRTAAYVAAARGDRERLAAIIEKAKVSPASARDIESQSTRLSQLLRTAVLTQRVASSDGQPLQVQSQAVAEPATGEDLKQVMVEVTLLLSQDTTTKNVGINLLDGLKLQFGAERTTEKRTIKNAPDTSTKVFTTALRIPDITYSLNIFNTIDEHYDVIVRPSLVASLGQPSEFFIGRQLSVGVSGINLGTIEKIDVGTTVKVLPVEISHERAKFRVDTIRSFFVPDTSGTFQESVTTFKQLVGATVEVEFGKTLILSGLYETVDLGDSSRVPLLGDIPVVDLLFNARTNTHRKDAALVLVTPRLPGTIETDTREFRTETLMRLLSFWKDLIDPNQTWTD